MRNPGSAHCLSGVILHFLVQPKYFYLEEVSVIFSPPPSLDKEMEAAEVRERREDLPAVTSSKGQLELQYPP